MADEDFYLRLSPFRTFASVFEGNRYHDVPATWRIVVTDVCGSTKAIEAGRYKDVNALGVASIVALRNALPGVQLPFVFGGDGATVLVPDSRWEHAAQALRGCRTMARSAFSMDLRVGSVTLSELYREGFALHVAKFGASDHAAFAMFEGSALGEAERRIKDPDTRYTYEVSPTGPAKADFRGFECRWQPIPSRFGHIVSLLVQSRERGPEARAVYSRVFRYIDHLLGPHEGRPVSPQTLHLARGAEAFRAEARIRSGEQSGVGNFAAAARARLSAEIGTFLMDRRRSALGFPGDTYRDEVTANSDFRKFDDMLRMVLDLDDEQRRGLTTFLEVERATGGLVYGMHSARSSLMTCAINQYEGDHVHFIDGADGGYALAAKELKAQLAMPVEEI